MQFELKLPTNHTLDSEPFTYPAPEFSIGDSVQLKNDDNEEESIIYIVVGLRIDWYTWIYDDTKLIGSPRWLYAISEPCGYIGSPPFREAKDLVKA